jgi:hypothetical protein
MRRNQLKTWNDLRYQTQFGSEHDEFPFFPAALELMPIATEAVHDLPPMVKAQLIDIWTSERRAIDGPAEAILDRCGTMVLELLVARARAAGRRAF